MFVENVKMIAFLLAGATALVAFALVLFMQIPVLTKQQKGVVRNTAIIFYVGSAAFSVVGLLM